LPLAASWRNHFLLCDQEPLLNRQPEEPLRPRNILEDLRLQPAAKKSLKGSNSQNVAEDD
jgi:hypothetical protein